MQLCALACVILTCARKQDYALFGSQPDEGLIAGLRVDPPPTYAPAAPHFAGGSLLLQREEQAFVDRVAERVSTELAERVEQAIKNATSHAESDIEDKLEKKVEGILNKAVEAWPTAKNGAAVAPTQQETPRAKDKPAGGQNYKILIAQKSMWKNLLTRVKTNHETWMKYLGPEDRVVTVLSDPGMKVSSGKLMEPSKRLRADCDATVQWNSDLHAGITPAPRTQITTNSSDACSRECTWQSACDIWVWQPTTKMCWMTIQTDKVEYGHADDRVWGRPCPLAKTEFEKYTNGNELAIFDCPDDHAVGMDCMVGESMRKLLPEVVKGGYDALYYVDDDVYLSVPAFKRVLGEGRMQGPVSFGIWGCATYSPPGKPVFGGYCGGGGFGMTRAAVEKLLSMRQTIDDWKDLKVGDEVKWTGSAPRTIQVETLEHAPLKADAFVTTFLNISLQIFDIYRKGDCPDDIAFGAAAEASGIKHVSVDDDGFFPWRLEDLSAREKAEFSCDSVIFHYISDDVKRRINQLQKHCHPSSMVEISSDPIDAKLDSRLETDLEFPLDQNVGAGAQLLSTSAEAGTVGGGAHDGLDFMSSAVNSAVRGAVNADLNAVNAIEKATTGGLGHHVAAKARKLDMLPGPCLDLSKKPTKESSKGVDVRYVKDIAPQLKANPTYTQNAADLNVNRWAADHHLAWMLHERDSKVCEPPVDKNMHFIWIGSPLREKHAKHIDACAKKNPGWNVYIWVDGKPEESDATPGISDLLDSDLVHFKPVAEEERLLNDDLIKGEYNPAGKSDYLRLEVVYLYGGIYLDTDTICHNSFDDYNDLFRWPFVSYTLGGYNNLCNGIFSFGRGSPFLKFAMVATRENCVIYNNCGTLTGAGPSFLTGAVLSYEDPRLVVLDQKYFVRNNKWEGSILTMDNEGNWLKLPGYVIGSAQQFGATSDFLTLTLNPQFRLNAKYVPRTEEASCPDGDPAFFAHHAAWKKVQEGDIYPAVVVDQGLAGEASPLVGYRGNWPEGDKELVDDKKYDVTQLASCPAASLDRHGEGCTVMYRLGRKAVNALLAPELAKGACGKRVTVGETLQKLCRGTLSCYPAPAAADAEFRGLDEKLGVVVKIRTALEAQGGAAVAAAAAPAAARQLRVSHGLVEAGQKVALARRSAKAFAPFLAFLHKFMHENQVTSVVDTFCGDWEHGWQSGAAWPDGLTYTGVDDNAANILSNKAYVNKNTHFLAQSVSTPLPSADLLLVVDAVSSRPFADTLELLAKNVYPDHPKYKYVLYVTEGIPKNIDPWNASPNLDVGDGAADQRALDLTRPPFNLPVESVLWWGDPADPKGQPRWVQLQKLRAKKHREKKA